MTPEDVHNAMLYDHAMEAISELFGDSDVSKSKTRENLNDLIGEINIMLDALADDDAETAP